MEDIKFTHSELKDMIRRIFWAKGIKLTEADTKWLAKVAKEGIKKTENE